MSPVTKTMPPDVKRQASKWTFVSDVPDGATEVVVQVLAVWKIQHAFVSSHWTLSGSYLGIMPNRDFEVGS